MTTSRELEDRRSAATDAAWRVLVRDGLRELSVRNVAAEAGIPPSSLRYIFPTQADLRRRAIERVTERVGERIQHLHVPQEDPSWPALALRELLPLDGERRMEMEVFLSLGTAAAGSPELRDPHRMLEDHVRQVCVDALTNLLKGAKPALHEVDHLHAVVDGVALHLVRQFDRIDSSRAVAVIDSYLRELATRAVLASGGARVEA